MAKKVTIKPRKENRSDGYANLLNKFGTSQDNSTAYVYRSDGFISDFELTVHYEENGLFSKIIDAPAEEAVKHGFTFDFNVPNAEEVIFDCLEALEWDENVSTAIKWARLYGGSIIVMMIDDGGSLEEPLNRYNIKGIDGLYVYERAIVEPDYKAALYGKPQYYTVNSVNGSFKVHASRCLVFKNGRLPELTRIQEYRFWGIPEYLRIHNQLRECSTSHQLGVEMLDRCVQAIYSMKGLANLLSTEDGEDKVLKRLRLIDMARGVLNSIAIDSDGETYDFKSMSLSGVKDIIDTTCNMLSAVTNIPQTILFGRSPAGENSTGESDFENYYNMCERIQHIMIKSNLKTLAEIILIAAKANGDIDEKPVVKVSFNPLWSLSDTEQAAVEQSKAATALTKAQTAQCYVDMDVLDPSEIRIGLASDKDFEIENLLDDLPDEDLMAGWEDINSEIGQNTIDKQV